MRVELARLFEPARPGSSQLDFSSQLGGGRASSIILSQLKAVGLTRVALGGLWECDNKRHT